MGEMKKGNVVAEGGRGKKRIGTAAAPPPPPNLIPTLIIILAES